MLQTGIMLWGKIFFPGSLCASRAEDRSTWEIDPAFWEEAALPVRLYPADCRNCGRHNGRVKRSQKITPLKLGAGQRGQGVCVGVGWGGRCFTTEKKSRRFPFLPPFGSETSGQISLPLFTIFATWHLSTTKNGALAVKVCQKLEATEAKVRS